MKIGREDNVLIGEGNVNNRYFYSVEKDQEGPRILRASASRWVNLKGVRLLSATSNRELQDLGGENVNRKGVDEEKVPAGCLSWKEGAPGYGAQMVLWIFWDGGEKGGNTKRTRGRRSKEGIAR
jgi:hypothetical protein